MRTAVSLRRRVGDWRLRHRTEFFEKYREARFEEKRIQWLLGFRKNGEAIIDVLPSGLKLEYQFHSAIGQQLFYRGRFEDGEIGFFSELLGQQTQPIILDVGANIGVHALSWAKTIPGSFVYAVEPDPRAVAILQRNVRLNRLKNVAVLKSAVSDHSGQAEFYCCNDDAFSSLKDTGRRPVVSKSLVPVTTIDEIVRSTQIGKLDLIKIDVEGLEREVIAGATATLTGMRSALFVEIYGGAQSNPDPSGTVRLINELGFEAFVFVAGRLVPYEQHNDDFYNYYFRPLPKLRPHSSRSSNH